MLEECGNFFFLKTVDVLTIDIHAKMWRANAEMQSAARDVQEMSRILTDNI